MRRERADEQPSARRLWAAIAQICNDGRANVRLDRHPRTLSALGTNKHLAGTPVDIIDLIENFFAKIKQFRAIATRYEKTAPNFLAAVQLVASVVWLN